MDAPPTRAAPAPTRAPFEPEFVPAPLPFDAATISRAMRRPDIAMELVLASPGRFAATLMTRERFWLALATAVVAATFAIPFGLYFGPTKVMHVAALFVGSVLVCYPSLHVFTAYVGLSLRAEQSAALAMLTAAVASTFSLGFAPIVFFLRETIDGGSTARAMAPVVGALLTVSTIAGMVQVLRCVLSESFGVRGIWFAFVMFGWFVLLGFIAMRMADVLGLSA
jgi:hypothetical protein